MNQKAPTPVADIGGINLTPSTGHTDTTKPGCALLFPTLCRPTATLWAPGQEPTVRPSGDRGLMMTRSLGDCWFRPVGVIAEPEIGRHALGIDDVALVAATDGVWDVLSLEHVAHIVRPAASARAAAAAVVQAALAAYTRDNFTAVVLRLDQLGGPWRSNSA